MLFFDTPFKLFPDLLEPPPYNEDTKIEYSNVNVTVVMFFKGCSVWLGLNCAKTLFNLALNTWRNINTQLKTITCIES